MSESTTSSKTSINADDDFPTPEVVLVDGAAKFRDGKRWKQRFCVLTKLSPAADCLQLQVYRDEKERARNGHTKASLSLQDFLAMESGFTLDKESHTLAIICQDLCVVLAFDNRERLIQWSVRIANNLGEGQHFLVQLASAPAKSKLTPGPVKLHVTDKKFCLTGGIPPRLLGAWEVPYLRRYGLVDGRIVFEGGSRCGKGEGVHVLVPDPPQLHLIIDALDMSAKGQLARAPSRRYGNGITDSPRKCMSSRLSEMRALSVMPADSTANISMNVNVNPPQICTTMSPTPRESRSAEALCSACGEVNGQPQNPSQMWMSSESSSRCDLDCDISGTAICPDESHSGHTGVRTSVGPHSPARNPMGQNQPLQIAKPLPSAMERCLSCMSKLGQQGQGLDILSPSWTMDLNVSSTSTNMGVASSMSTNVSTGLQGSIGSGNSDRLSISSHGSSGAGGPADYYYDTPRSVLVAEMRRNARSNTPPGMFQNNQMSNNYHTGQQQGVGITSGGCSSPCRAQSHISSVSTAGCCNSSNQNHNGSSMCAMGNCHCQSASGVSGVPGTNRVVGGHGHLNSHIYYNGVAEQKSLGGNKPPQPINLHPGGPGPYENYDFPRCVPSHGNPNAGCYPYGLNEDGSSGLNGTSSMSSIDWNKKLPMDRSSVATTASTSISLVGSSSDQEFYDTPRQLCPCCTQSPNPQTGCPCCSQTSQPAQPPPLHHSGNNNHHHQHQHQLSHYHQNPSCIMRRDRDPLENYDVPPHNNPHNVGLSTNQQMQYSVSTSISINGEGKMPLVAGSIPTRSNPNAIYAQVDKSKKTPRPMPNQQFTNCDSHPIYENRNTQIQHQPTYMNLDGGGGNITNNKILKPPAPEPNLDFSQPQPPLPTLQECGHSNYVNLQFAESLQLYENAREISGDFVTMTTKETQVLVHPEPTHEIETIVENEYENSAVQTVPVTEVIQANEVKKVASQEVGKVKESKSVEKGSNSASASTSASTSAEESRRGSQGSDDAVSLPLRRSSSVPCKGGHANRGSASSSDSGVSGDGGLFFDDSSPSNDIGSLCLHESLPRKSQRTSPGTSNGKNTSTTSTPRPQESVENVEQSNVNPPSPNLDPTLANRHYETIDEVESNSNKIGVISSNSNGTCNSSSNSVNGSLILSKNPVNPSVAAVKNTETVQTHKRNLVSDANSTSSGNSDMSDYIETLSTLSSCSRGSGDTVTMTGSSVLVNGNGPVNLNISASPKKSTSMKPRSGKEYFKIDRSMFKND